MAITVHIAFVAWALLSLVLFHALPPRKAVLVCVIGGALFLPNAGYDVYFLHHKWSIISTGALLFSLLFHRRLWTKLRFRLVDVPILLWCLVCPFVSTMANDIGLYDAVSAVLDNSLTWGAPYVLGRIYFATLDGLRELALGIIVGGVLYVPLCWWEIRMSPHLHFQLYGYYQHDFIHTVRYGGFRPMVFKQGGLAVSLWMAGATIQAFWLWKARTLKTLSGIPMDGIVAILAVTTLLCKSFNGILLAGFGCLAYYLTRISRAGWVVALLVAGPPSFMFLRATQRISTVSLVQTVGQMNEERASSLQYRINNENLLVQKALEQPVLGWARWGRSRVHGAYGFDAPTDSLWIITFGQYGILGLASLTALLSLPAVILWRRCPPRFWTHRKVAAAVGLTLLCGLYMVDNLFNAMYDPAFLLAVGAVVGLRRRSVALALSPALPRYQAPQLQPPLPA